MSHIYLFFFRFHVTKSITPFNKKVFLEEFPVRITWDVHKFVHTCCDSLGDTPYPSLRCTHLTP